LREADPFTDAQSLVLPLRETSPYVNRVRLLWQKMRGPVIERFPKAPGLPRNVAAYMKRVEEAQLQDSEKASWRDRYHSYARQLANEGFRVPGKLFAPYGLRVLIRRLERMKAHEIPEILVHALRVNLSKAEIKRYNDIRDIRNKIAHGQATNPSLKDAVG